MGGGGNFPAWLSFTLLQNPKVTSRLKQTAWDKTASIHYSRLAYLTRCFICTMCIVLYALYFSVRDAFSRLLQIHPGDRRITDMIDGWGWIGKIDANHPFVPIW